VEQNRGQGSSQSIIEETDDAAIEGYQVLKNFLKRSDAVAGGLGEGKSKAGLRFGARRGTGQHPSLQSGKLL